MLDVGTEKISKTWTRARLPIDVPLVARDGAGCYGELEGWRGMGKPMVFTCRSVLSSVWWDFQWHLQGNWGFTHGDLGGRKAGYFQLYNLMPLTPGWVERHGRGVKWGFSDLETLNKRRTIRPCFCCDGSILLKAVFPLFWIGYLYGTTEWNHRNQTGPKPETIQSTVTI